MSNDKDFFSEALDPANEDNWFPFLQAKTNQNRENIYRITIPGMSTQILKATVLSDQDDVWGYIELAPNTSELPIFRIPTRYVEQYCPAPTLPTEILSDIYNVEVDHYSEGTVSFDRMVLDPDELWIGVNSENGNAYYVLPKNILSFSLTPTKP